MPRRASVDRRSSVGRVLRNVRRDVEVTQIVDELAHIVSLVGAEREPSRSRRIAHNHRLGRFAFDGSGRRAEFGLDHQTMTVLGQRVADVAELGLLAFALAIEPFLRVAGRSVRMVAACLAMEVTFAVAAARGRLVRAILGAEALHRCPRAATCVPSTEKCSSDSSRRTSLWFTSSARNLWATSASNSRSRFFVNTVGTHTGSSIPSPTNQRSPSGSY